MRHAAWVMMSMRELDRLKCIQAVVDRELYPGIAAERFEISTRQLRRIAQRYRAEGPRLLFHHGVSNCGTASARAALRRTKIAI
jgi:hypothetical protein